MTSRAARDDPGAWDRVDTALLRSAKGGELLSTGESDILTSWLIPSALIDPSSWKDLFTVLLRYATASQRRPKLTMEVLGALRIDAMAGDVRIPDGSFAWTEAEASSFFESGGEEWPRQRTAEKEMVATLLCGLCASPSGIEVDVHLGAASQGAKCNAVLILGFGGATMRSLQPLIELYR